MDKRLGSASWSPSPCFLGGVPGCFIGGVGLAGGGGFFSGTATFFSGTAVPGVPTHVNGKSVGSTSWCQECSLYSYLSKAHDDFSKERKLLFYLDFISWLLLLPAHAINSQLIVMLVVDSG